MENIFLKVTDVMKLLSVSQPYAYKIMRELNREMQKLGYLTIAGRVNKQFFMKKFFYKEGR